MKRVFIVHGWGGNPGKEWFPWIKKELEGRGYEVSVPEMPNTGEPEVNAWVSHLASVVGEADGDTFFVGHSIGCQAILRYLEKLPDGITVGGAVFVAGWLTLKNLEEGSVETARPWLETPIDFGKVRSRAKKFAALFSTNDHYVPSVDSRAFEKKLGASIIVLENRGHFSESEGTTEVPEALEEVLRMSGG